MAGLARRLAMGIGQGVMHRWGRCRALPVFHQLGQDRKWQNTNLKLTSFSFGEPQTTNPSLGLARSQYRTTRSSPAVTIQPGLDELSDFAPGTDKRRLVSSSPPGRDAKPCPTMRDRTEGVLVGSAGGRAAASWAISTALLGMTWVVSLDAGGTTLESGRVDRTSYTSINFAVSAS
jgi:hypothetical protein